MNRALLACIALALPQFAVAAPCDVLPYANQCQGSNLWPIPAGWTADTDGDCQPQPPFRFPATSKVAIVAGSSTAYFYCTNPWGDSPTSAVANCCSSLTGNAPAGECGPIGNDEGFSYGSGNCASSGTLLGTGLLIGSGSSQCNQWAVGLVSKRNMSVFMGSSWKWWCPDGSAGVGVINGVYMCQVSNPELYQKPSDGQCTARWTSADKTAVQKDPMDPDCDAESCVINGTCKLK